MTRAQRWMVASASLVAVSLAAGGVIAVGMGDLGTYLVRKGSDSRVRFSNPGQNSAFAMQIQYETDGTFYDCQGIIVPPRQSVDDGRAMDGSGGIGVKEVIVVSEGRGKIQGISVKDHKSAMLAHDPRTFMLPDDKDDRADLKECVCNELALSGMRKGALKKFGFKC